MKITDDVGVKILGAFRGPSNQLRSVAGISHSTGLDFDIVNTYLHEHDEIFIEYPLVPSGTHLYKLDKAKIDIR